MDGLPRLEGDALADRAFRSEEFPGEVLVDDGHARSGFGIAVVEGAALQQGNRQQMEKAGRNRASQTVPIGRLIGLGVGCAIVGI
jgi:hypothetical protein